MGEQVKLKLISKDGISKVMAGDKEVFGVLGAKFEHDGADLPTLYLKVFVPEVEVELLNNQVTIEEIMEKIVEDVE